MHKSDDLIYVLNKKIGLHQAPEGFRTSMDSIMLGAACPVRAGQSVLDLGCGVGSAGLCILYRVKEASLLGVDIQGDHIELAAKNAALNDMAERSSFLCADIRDLPSDIGTFEHVVCNPPYKESGEHRISPSKAKALAMGHIDDEMSLRVWIDSAWMHIKGQGSLTMIHEAGRLDSIVHALFSERGGRRFGNIEVFPIFTKPKKEARRVIIRAWKHKKSGSRLLKGITLHNADGSYTIEAEAVLRDACPLIF